MERRFMLPPTCDMPQDSPRLVLARAIRNFTETDERFSSMKQNEPSRRKRMDDKWQRLRRKQRLLTLMFVHFNKFISENQVKFKRAERRTQQSKEALERKRTDMAAMRIQCAKMMEDHRLLEVQVKAYAVFEDFLSSVVAACPEYNNTGSIMDRLEALIEVKSRLKSWHLRDVDKMEKVRLEMTKIIENKMLYITEVRHQLSVLQWRYDEAFHTFLKWELALNRLNEVKRQQHIKHTLNKDALWHLYVEICKDKGISPTADKADFETQISVIQWFLQGFKTISQMVKAQNKKAVMTPNFISAICFELARLPAIQYEFQSILKRLDIISRIKSTETYNINRFIRKYKQGSQFIDAQGEHATDLNELRNILNQMLQK